VHASERVSVSTLTVKYLRRGTNRVPLALITCSERSSDAGIVRGTIRDAKFHVPRNKVRIHIVVFNNCSHTVPYIIASCASVLGMCIFLDGRENV
jgi:hypothetical protein